jgi:hypothetical protein
MNSNFIYVAVDGNSLESEEEEESHHETEEPHRLGQCETQNRVRKQLLLQ